MPNANARLNTLTEKDTGRVVQIDSLIDDLESATVTTSTGEQTLVEALDGRVIYQDTLLGLQALPTEGMVDGQLATVSGTSFRWTASSSEWTPQDGYVTIDSFSGTESERLQAAIDYVAASSVISFIKIPRLVSVNATVQIRPGVSFFMTQSGALQKAFDGPTDSSISAILSDDTHGSGDNMFFGGRVIGRHENDISGAIAASDTGQRDVFFYARDGKNYYFDGVFVNGFSYNGIRFDGSSTTEDPSKIVFINGGIDYCASNGLWCKHGINDIKFHGNNCSWLGFSAIGVDDLSSGESYGPPIARISILGNTVRKSSQKTLTGALFVAAASNVTIGGNNISECGVPGSVGGNGISIATGGDVTVGLNECKNVTVSGNTIKNVESSGISFNGVKSSQIMGNTILNIGGGSGVALSNAAPTGLPVEGCEDVSVGGNWIGSDNGTPVTRGVYVVSPASSNNRIMPDNTFVNVTDEIVDNGTDTAGQRQTQNSNVMPGYRDQRMASFTVVIRNNAGTLEHRIVSAMFTTDPDYYDGINGANDTYTATPTVTSTVGFTDGAGIQGIADLVFDTQNMADGGMGTASIGRNSTGTPLDVRIEKTSGDIDGTVRDRLSLIFFEASTGDQFNLNTTNIPAGAALECQVLCLLAR